MGYHLCIIFIYRFGLGLSDHSGCVERRTDAVVSYQDLRADQSVDCPTGTGYVVAPNIVLAERSTYFSIT